MLRLRSAIVLGLVTLAAGVGGALTVALAGPQVRAAAHDFGAHDGGGCVSCHPQHSPNGRQPAWDPRSPARFTWSDTSQTTGGTRLPTNVDTWTGSTRVCLSCHDGSVDTRSFASSGRHRQASGDLKGNHPVAVPYPYGLMKNTYNGITTGDRTPGSGWVATPQGVRLYADPASPGSSNRGIECASCHDPHGSVHPKLLRVSMDRGELCLSCHRK